MKYLMVLCLMFTIGCTGLSSDICNYIESYQSKHEPIWTCTKDPIKYCKNKCKQHLTTIIRIDTNPTNGGLYSCSCDDQ